MTERPSSPLVRNLPYFKGPFGFKLLNLTSVRNLPYPILTSHFDSTLTFEFSTSFCQYLSVIVFDLSSFLQKSEVAGLH
jgi:hypothetical protein